MNINRINPYLRYVNELTYGPSKEYHCSMDYHLFYIKSEVCTVDLKSAKHHVTKGSTVLIPPGVPYLFRVPKQLHWISINFDYTQEHAHEEKPYAPIKEELFSPDMILERVEFEQYPFLNAPLILNNMSYLKNKFDAILTENRFRKKFYQEMCSATLKNILVELIRHAACNGKSNKEINHILSYIHEHYGEELRNEQLAQMIGYHPYHLNRLMNIYIGTTMHQYLLNYRMEMAKKHLRETDLSILEISEICGYRNFSNFSNDFKKKTGLSPSVYRAEESI